MRGGNGISTRQAVALSPLQARRGKERVESRKGIGVRQMDSRLRRRGWKGMGRVGSLLRAGLMVRILDQGPLFSSGVRGMLRLLARIHDEELASARATGRRSSLRVYQRGKSVVVKEAVMMTSATVC